MAKQDDWIRITLRLPPELHEKLYAVARNSSLNAEIVARLEESFSHRTNADLEETVTKLLTKGFEELVEQRAVFKLKFGNKTDDVDVDVDVDKK